MNLIMLHLKAGGHHDKVESRQHGRYPCRVRNASEGLVRGAAQIHVSAFL